MDEAFAQKLRLWLVSMMALIVFAISGAVMAYAIGPRCVSGDDRTSCLFTMAGGLALFMVGFLPLAIWHLFDFLQIGTPEGRSGRFFSSYPIFSSVMMTCGILLTLIGSGQFWITDCPAVNAGPGKFAFVTCIERPHTLLVAPFYLLLLFAFLLCMGKAVISIRSRLKKVA